MKIDIFQLILSLKKEIIICVILTLVFIQLVKFVLGETGERKVNKKIKSIYKNNNEYYRLLTNILLPAKGRNTTQVDHILINKHGIFVIETKNYSAYKIVGHEYEKYWTSFYRFNTHTFYNPIKQNVGHIIAVKKLAKNIPIYNRVVFVNEVDLSEVYSSNIFNFNNLSINSFSTPYNNLTKEQIDNIYKTIKQHNKMNFFNNIIHILNVKFIKVFKR